MVKRDTVKLILLAALLLLTACIPYRDMLIDDIPRTHVNEKCRIFRHYWDCTDAEFLAHVHWMIEDTDWVRIRIIRWNGATDRRGHIMQAVVYYTKLEKK